MHCPIICLHKQCCQNLMKLGTYIADMAFLQEMKYMYFQIWTSTSGVRSSAVAEASFYNLQGKLICNLGYFH